MTVTARSAAQSYECRRSTCRAMRMLAQEAIHYAHALVRENAELRRQITEMREERARMAVQAFGAQGPSDE